MTLTHLPARNSPGRTSHARLTRRSAILALFAVVCLALLPARAQSFDRRNISGIVTLDGKTVSNATVFLQDAKTKDLRSFTSNADGSFSFAQVGMIDDYQVWAQKGARKSKIHAVSSFDTRTDVHMELKLK